MKSNYINKIAMIKIVVIFIVQIVLQIVNNLFLIDCSQQQQW